MRRFTRGIFLLPSRKRLRLARATVLRLKLWRRPQYTWYGHPSSPLPVIYETTLATGPLNLIYWFEKEEPILIQI